jgi:hypothetical protein
MKKKIPPAKQTDELNRVRLEFLQRNKAELDKLKELVDRDEKQRDEITTRLSMDNQKLKQAWDFFLRQNPVTPDLDQKVKELETTPAANAVWPFLYFAMKNANDQLMGKGFDLQALSRDELTAKFLDYLCAEARRIFDEMTAGRPLKHLLVGIDLTRSKEVIMAEVAELLTLHKLRTGVSEMPKARLKYLPMVPELLAVWDAWAEYGQRRCFHLIARKLKIPESTVKLRWRRAYQEIHGQDYTKETAAKSADKLCASCKDQGKCYKIINGTMERLPCAAYLKLTGKSYQREKLVENFEAMADQYAFEDQ